MDYIKEKVDHLIKVHETNDPYRIAKEKNIIVLHENLGSIFGYYNIVSRTQMIHINGNMNEQNQLFTCAHELGHAILHPRENTPQLSKVTMRSELFIEREANEFATKLIISNSKNEDYDFISRYDVLDYYGIPYEMERFIEL